MENAKNTYDYIVTPYPERISKALHLPYQITWVLFSLLLFFLHYIICKYSGTDVQPKCLLIVLSVLPCLLAICIVSFSKSLEKFTPALFLFVNRPKDKTLEWHIREVTLIFKDVRLIVSGMLLAGVCLGTLPTNAYWLSLNLLPKITYSIILFFIGIFGGGVLYIMIRIAYMIHKIATLELKVSVYQHPATSLKAIGSLLARIAFAIVFIYMIGVSSIFLEARMQNGTIISVTAFFGLCVLCFFVFPQIKIHQIMSKVKHMRLRAFSVHLEDSLSAVMEKPTRETVQHVRELFDVQQSLNQMGEWPFDTKLLFAIITGIAVPVLIVLFQFICDQCKQTV